jgi:hypothetical protein
MLSQMAAGVGVFFPGGENNAYDIDILDLFAFSQPIAAQDVLDVLPVTDSDSPAIEIEKTCVVENKLIMAVNFPRALPG